MLAPLFLCFAVSLFICFTVLLFCCFSVTLFLCYSVSLFCCFSQRNSLFCCLAVLLSCCFAVSLSLCFAVSSLWFGSTTGFGFRHGWILTPLTLASRLLPISSANNRRCIDEEGCGNDDRPSDFCFGTKQLPGRQSSPARQQLRCKSRLQPLQPIWINCWPAAGIEIETFSGDQCFQSFLTNWLDIYS